MSTRKADCQSGYFEWFSFQKTHRTFSNQQWLQFSWLVWVSPLNRFSNVATYWNCLGEVVIKNPEAQTNYVITSEDGTQASVFLKLSSDPNMHPRLKSTTLELPCLILKLVVTWGYRVPEMLWSTWRCVASLRCILDFKDSVGIKECTMSCV